MSTPVLLVHGTTPSSADFMINPRSESLAFILADNGYDVWLANSRGTQFSYEKVTSSGEPYVAKGRDMYETAWQFMADYDMPAALDLILEETGHEKIHLVSHSSGAATVAAFFAGNHSYDDRIGLYVGMAPSLLNGDDTDLTVKISYRLLPLIIERLPKCLFEIVAQMSIPGMYQSLINQFLYPFCHLFPSVCVGVINSIQQRGIINKVIPNPLVSRERATVISTIWPGGTTVMAVYAISALIYMEKKAWTKIDFRKIPHTGFTNENMYNSTEPPVFNFANAHLNTTFIFARNDVFTSMDSAREIIAWLKPTNSLIIDDDRFSHVDFLWSWKAPCLVYGFVVKQFTEFDDARGADYVKYRRSVWQHLEDLTKPRCASQGRL